MQTNRKYIIFGIILSILFLTLITGIYIYYQGAKEPKEKVNLQKENLLQPHIQKREEHKVNEEIHVLMTESKLIEKIPGEIGKSRKGIYQITSNGIKELLYDAEEGKSWVSPYFTPTKDIFIINSRPINNPPYQSIEKLLLFTKNRKDLINYTPSQYVGWDLREVLRRSDNTLFIKADYTKGDPSISLKNGKTGEEKIVRLPGENPELTSAPGIIIHGWDAQEKWFYVSNGCYETACPEMKIWRINSESGEVTKINFGNSYSDYFQLSTYYSKGFGVKGGMSEKISGPVPPHQILQFNLSNASSTILYQNASRNRIIRNLLLSSDGKKLSFNENEYRTGLGIGSSEYLYDDVPGLKKNIKILNIETRTITDLGITGDLVAVYKNSDKLIYRKSAGEDLYEWILRDIPSGEEKMIVKGHWGQAPDENFNTYDFLTTF